MTPQDYLESYSGYFWQWEEEGTYITTYKGRTICHREYLLEVLEAMKDKGLPRLGTLLLLLLATSAIGRSDIGHIRNLIKKHVQLSRDVRVLRIVQAGEKFLLELVELPPQYKTGRKRLLLLQAIFHPFYNHLEPSEVRKLYSYLKSAPFSSGDEPWKPLEAKISSVIYADFGFLAHLSKVHPGVESILKRMAGLPAIAKEMLELEPPAEKQDFIQELMDDHRTFHLGSLIRHIWSGLNIPLHQRLPSTQPFGGVSDLSNKGDLHRLLVSELANDEIVFLSRLANQEALYSNREMPPQANNHERIILIDVSLKSWGTPRTIAMALMLAIARHPKTDIPCKAFALGLGYRQLAFGTIHEVIDSLQELDLCLHPAAGLERFFQDYPPARKAEIIFIAAEETLRLPAMQQARSRFDAFIDYWIQTGQQGEIDLYKKHGTHRQHIKTMLLPLSELWKKEMPAPEHPMSETTRTQYPLRFLGSSRPKALLPLGEQQFLVTTEGSLLYRVGKTTPYWELLYENLPAGADYFEVGQLESGERVLLAFNPYQKELTLLNIGTGEKKRFTLEKSVPAFIFHQDCFFSPDASFAFGFGDKLSIKSTTGQDDESQLRQTIQQLHEHRKIAREKAGKRYHFVGQVLKNLQAVYLNPAGNLVFNIHELTLHNHHFTLKANKEKASRQKTIEARPTGTGEFTFPDGSQVLIHRCGMLTLKSNSETDLTIYVPSVLNQSLGVATQLHHSGNEAFFSPNATETTQLPPEQFFSNYLLRLIQNIQRHATAS